jgi:beta-glucanase (GH16 family)
VWNDEFSDASTLSTKWSFESGGGGWGNGEAQYYCAGGEAPNGAKTAQVSDGTLRITARKVTPSAATDHCSYVSARMNTKSKWQYGYMEMRAKLPEEAGTWSAFWMLPDAASYPAWVRDPSRKGGELDIVEYVPNDDPGVVYFSAHSYNATPEAGGSSGYTAPGTSTQYPYYGTASVSTPGEWHCYGLEWTHTYVKAYLDGVPYYYAPNPSPDYATPDANPYWGFDKPFYIKLNLALGGSWGGTIDPGFTIATYEIDYIRVYQK